MIIENICNSFLELILNLVEAMNIPDLPESITNALDTLIDVFEYAIPIIGFFLPWNIVGPFIPIILIVTVSLPAYHITMWILRKIPGLGIK